MTQQDDIIQRLNEIHADAGYLFGRAAADGACAGAMVESVRTKIDAVKTLLSKLRAPVAGEAVAHAVLAFGRIQRVVVNEDMAHEYADQWRRNQDAAGARDDVTVRPLVYGDAAPQASAEDDRAALAHKVNLLTTESLGHRSAAGHLSALVDELSGHLIEARQAMADFQQAFVPAFDTPETLTMVPNEALVPFCAVLDRLRGLDLPQADKGAAPCSCPSGDGSLRPCPVHPGADKDGGQQRAEYVDVSRLMTAAKGMTKLYGHVWDRTDGALVVFPENVARFDAAFDALRAAVGEVVDDATQPEQGERDA
ncbi:hypothetical protein [Achromobacter ruhlandii]|uniref:hypothetical protein n=1 Tax=Achromobacter ruhlandii TaxID=72557 RepID=UPI001E3CAE13|nr:hypothetical protein [Achromobacter ruhlandii]